VDAHVTVPAAQAVEPGQMLAVMGTSTCHVMNGTVLAAVPGMCGVVDGGITPGFYGYEAGQSGVGDIFAWWTRTGVPAAYAKQAEDNGESIHELLTRLAADQQVGEHGLVALDWMNGNRSILVDHELSGVIVGLTLATRPEEVYRALLESTAFGTRKIIETFTDQGVPVEELVIAGGLTKNAFLMQLYADVTGRPLSIIGSEQGPALGSAIHAAVAAGEYPDVTAASKSMGRVDRDVYVPDESRQAAYDSLYAEYSRLHDYFGRGDDEGNDVLHRLRRLRNEASSR
jgi:L-ribulokinase